jgi:DNA-binding IclR family transcriptional regulator
MATLHGDRNEGLTGISAPVFGGGGELLGALTLTLPTSRMKAGLENDVLAAAQMLTQAVRAGARSV